MELMVREETSSFISPDQWSPNSPDLNPVDYKIVVVMQQRIYQTKILLRRRNATASADVWHSAEQRTIDE